MNSTKPDPTRAIEQTHLWVERAVVGLNLCPFAKAPLRKGLIRYVLCPAHDTEALREALIEQLQWLHVTPITLCETLLLVHPYALQDFDEYLLFVRESERLLKKLRLTQEFQIASFHPHYQFAHSSRGDVANDTNRSPHPMLHILRHASLDKAFEGIEDTQVLAQQITQRNRQTLLNRGANTWEQLWQ